MCKINELKEKRDEALLFLSENQDGLLLYDALAFLSENLRIDHDDPEQIRYSLYVLERIKTFFVYDHFYKSALECREQ